MTTWNELPAHLVSKIRSDSVTAPANLPGAVPVLKYGNRVTEVDGIRFDSEKEADFIPVVVWGKIAELVGNSCSKGHRLLVEGRLQIRSYDAKDGTKRWVTEIIANSVEFIERKASGGGVAASAGEMGTKSEMEMFGQAVQFDEEIPF